MWPVSPDTLKELWRAVRVAGVPGHLKGAMELPALLAPKSIPRDCDGIRTRDLPTRNPSATNRCAPVALDRVLPKNDVKSTERVPTEP